MLHDADRDQLTGLQQHGRRNGERESGMEHLFGGDVRCGRLRSQRRDEEHDESAPASVTGLGERCRDAEDNCACADLQQEAARRRRQACRSLPALAGLVVSDCAHETKE
jgi:uncharacterized protein YceH (UPF0502 family)